nr:MAG TPA: hypothetical protein [Caudoviricetes sp.]
MQRNRKNNKKCPRRLCNKRRGHFAFPAEGASACPQENHTKNGFGSAMPKLGKWVVYCRIRFETLSAHMGKFNTGGLFFDDPRLMQR